MNRKNVLDSLHAIASLALALFVPAGRCDLPMVWAYFLVYTGLILAMRLVIFKRDPDLLKERNWPRPGIKEWDRRLGKIRQFLHLATWGIAGLDVGRLHWSDTIPFGAQMVGLVGLAASSALTVWAMSVNTFFSRWVRIQRERGHRVVTAGPYQYVRHPGYLANIFLWLCSGLALGSWLAMVPATGMALLLVYRTAREDLVLREELAGYAAYAEQVRYRLVPGLW